MESIILAAYAFHRKYNFVKILTPSCSAEIRAQGLPLLTAHMWVGHSSPVGLNALIYKIEIAIFHLSTYFR